MKCYHNFVAHLRSFHGVCRVHCCRKPTCFPFGGSKVLSVSITTPFHYIYTNVSRIYEFTANKFMKNLWILLLRKHVSFALRFCLYSICFKMSATF